MTSEHERAVHYELRLHERQQLKHDTGGDKPGQRMQRLVVAKYAQCGSRRNHDRDGP